MSVPRVLESKCDPDGFRRSLRLGERGDVPVRLEKRLAAALRVSPAHRRERRGGS